MVSELFLCSQGTSACESFLDSCQGKYIKGKIWRLGSIDEGNGGSGIEPLGILRFYGKMKGLI